HVDSLAGRPAVHGRRTPYPQSELLALSTEIRARRNAWKELSDPCGKRGPANALKARGQLADGWGPAQTGSHLEFEQRVCGAARLARNGGGYEQAARVRDEFGRGSPVRGDDCPDPSLPRLSRP